MLDLTLGRMPAGVGGYSGILAGEYSLLLGRQRWHDLGGFGRPAKQKALRRIATQGAQEGELGRGLHALRHHLLAEGVGHA